MQPKKLKILIKNEGKTPSPHQMGHLYHPLYNFVNPSSQNIMLWHKN